MLFIFSFFTTDNAVSAVIEGVVVSESGILENPQVQAYRNISEIALSSPYKTSVKGDKKGHFRLELPDGKYWLTASGTDGEHQNFSFHGNNPINAEGKLWLPFAATRITAQVDIESKNTILSGVVLYHNKPVSEAFVSIYLPENDKTRGMGLQSVMTDSNGKFAIPLQPSTYRVIARKKFSEGSGMQLSKKDLFCYFNSNPVLLKENSETKIEIGCYPKDDIKNFQIKGEPVKRKKSDLVRLREFKPESNENPLYGVITDTSGNPLSKLKIMAFRKERGTPFSMNLLRLDPDISASSDIWGKFSLNLEAGEEYAIIAREMEGVAPAKGEYFGIYEGNSEHSVNISTKNINIKAEKIMVGHLAENNRKKASKPSIKVNQTFKNRVIENDETWGGDIIVTGKVVVARSATLKILPGTNVKFRKIDLDNDGVGDTEIRVLGALKAEGTTDNPITFASAEKNPAKSDWSYILFFTSPDINVMRNCFIRDAFSGIQSHFSSVSVTNSIFENNNEGVRFGRADMDLESNRFTNNNIGIRFHRIEGEVVIKNNSITKNDTGIFFVPSGQNRIDFLTGSYLADPLYIREPVIKNNIIAYNSSYNFKYGFRQKYNLDISGNWWGTAVKSEIIGKIMDNRIDNELGSVQFEPYLQVQP